MKANVLNKDKCLIFIAKNLEQSCFITCYYCEILLFLLLIIRI